MNLTEHRIATNNAAAAEINAIESRLDYLRNGRKPAQKFETTVSLVFDDASVVAFVPSKTKRSKKSPMSAAQLASRKIQGTFLGLLRHSPKSKRFGYKAIAKASGREAAIEAMRRARG